LGSLYWAGAGVALVSAVGTPVLADPGVSTLGPVDGFALVGNATLQYTGTITKLFAVVMTLCVTHPTTVSDIALLPYRNGVQLGTLSARTTVQPNETQQLSVSFTTPLGSGNTLAVFVVNLSTANVVISSLSLLVS